LTHAVCRGYIKTDFITGRKTQSEVLFVRARASLKARLAAIAISIHAAVTISAGADWRDDWNEALNAAKKEGKVTVITDVTAAIRDALTLPFQVSGVRLA
jgi:hypothetical protein